MFCLDRGFEDPDAFSAARETDARDDQSAHFIVQNMHTRKWVAATRIVMPRPGQHLPVDRLGVFERSRLMNAGEAVGEVSRFCINNKRFMDSALPEDVLPGPNSLAAWGIGAIGTSQQFEVTLGIIRTIIIFSLKRHIDYCVMLITEAFARLLPKLEVSPHQVGSVTEHRGMRTPYFVNMCESGLSLSKKSSAVRKLLKRSRHAYARISSVAGDDRFDSVSEYSPDYFLVNESVFRESVLAPAEQDSGLSLCSGEFARAGGQE